MKNNKTFELFVTIITATSVFVILADYAYNLSASQKLAIYIYDLIVVIILGVDFYLRMKASNQGLKFILRHWYEIPAMLPLFVFAIIESYTIIGAAARSVRLIRLFRLIHLFFRTTTIFGDTRFVYLIIFTFSAITIGAIGEYIVESPVKDSKITTIGDAFWWAVVTATTVGYGDLYPITVEGKIIAVAVMVLGIATLGIFISTIGANLIESRIKRKDKTAANTNAKSGLLVDDTKILIKNKVDEIENLTIEEVTTLTAIILTLHSKVHRHSED